ncbi:MAG: glycosyltransferase family 9 protein [Bacteroidales bacterium]|nr:glycosyltransferase family 9 protein [Bacteroidales bacterium]
MESHENSAQYLVKFLVIRFSSIGDIVLTTPVVRCLKQQVEHTEIHFLTKPEYAYLLESNPYIDKVHTLKIFSQTKEELRNEHFDYVIDLHNNLRSLRFKHKLKVYDFSFKKLNYEKFLLTKFKKNKLPDIHIVDRYLNTVELFDVENDGLGLDYFIDEKSSEKYSELFKDIPEKYIVIAIGAQHNTKKMPLENIAKLCSLINSEIIFIGGKEDEGIAEKIIELSENKSITSFCGRINVDGSAILIKNACLIISHDTGMMHIAAAFKKIIFSIWGNTVPKFGMYPYMADEKSQVFEVENLSCRPCSKIGKEKCPKKHFRCMKDQNIELIATEANKIMS